MAQIIGGIGTSHVPAIGAAIAVLRTAATQAAEQRAIAASSPRGTKVV